MAEDKDSKKHPASAQKKKQLKKKGQTPKSQDVPMAFGLIAAFGAIIATKDMFLGRLRVGMETYIGAIRDVGQPQGIDTNQLLMKALVDVAYLSAPVLFAVMAMAVVSNVAQTGFILTGEQLKPNINKLNPMTKLKQWFSKKSLQELGKSLAKILVAGVLGWVVFQSSLNDIAGAVQISTTNVCQGNECAMSLLMLGAGIIKKLFMYIIILYVLVAVTDFSFQRKNFENDNKMSDKEVKDEYKNSEGDPYQKGKRRQMAQQMAQQGMQEEQNVGYGSVVVINPTELAVVLKYDADVSPVPWVIGKGEVDGADRIRAAARDTGVPVVRNKPLARALYAMCELGDIVPEELYRPVAEVLAYVFGLQEQLRAEASDAAASAQMVPGAVGSPGAAASPRVASSATDAAAAASRVDSGGDGVHDLGSVQVPVLPDQAAAAATSGLAAGAPQHGTWDVVGGAVGAGAVANGGIMPAYATAMPATMEPAVAWGTGAGTAPHHVTPAGATGALYGTGTPYVAAPGAAIPVVAAHATATGIGGPTWAPGSVAPTAHDAAAAADDDRFSWR